jgi:hypothetical protein
MSCVESTAITVWCESVSLNLSKKLWLDSHFRGCTKKIVDFIFLTHYIAKDNCVA